MASRNTTRIDHMVQRNGTETSTHMLSKALEIGGKETSIWRVRGGKRRTKIIPCHRIVYVCYVQILSLHFHAFYPLFSSFSSLYLSHSFVQRVFVCYLYHQLFFFLSSPTHKPNIMHLRNGWLHLVSR